MIKSLVFLLFGALPLCAAPLTVSDNAELEHYLAPMKEAAESGDIASTRQVYLNYGMAGCEEQAKAWADFFLSQLREKAEAGNVKAMNTLGRAYLLGDTLIKADPAQATVWYTKASEAGDPAAAYMLGDLHDKQKQPDEAKVAYARAYGLYKQQAEAGNQEARYWAAYMQLMGIGCEPNPEAGSAALEELAQSGYIPAAYQLFKYEVPRDPQKALSCAKQLADEGQDPQMAYFLASTYLKDKDAAKQEEGKQYLKQAVDGGVPAACYHQAWLLDQEGKDKEAYPLYLSAARQGHADAAVKVGTMLLEGRGVEKDESTGLSWLQKACEVLKSPIAPYELGRYYDRIGEWALANSWYVIASDRGLAEAMSRRGLLHLIPFSGVDWSPTQAYQWWRNGSSVNDPDCKLALRLYLYVFTPLLLVLVFALPVYTVHRLNKKLEQKP